MAFFDSTSEVSDGTDSTVYSASSLDLSEYNSFYDKPHLSLSPASGNAHTGGTYTRDDLDVVRGEVPSARNGNRNKQLNFPAPTFDVVLSSNLEVSAARDSFGSALDNWMCKHKHTWAIHGP